ncbi:hypothetical protein [Massilia sp. 9096]|uniref:hypothetical protein n=1 Tax=Massilia sp. 9096 TaxID=1500894 RepID=UPI0012DFFD0D|nr:hypothetical protein [Massilia sp. 9096]
MRKGYPQAGAHRFDEKLTDSAFGASSQILWKRLLARRLSFTQAVEIEGFFLTAAFLGMSAGVIHSAYAPRLMQVAETALHINCGKQCEQKPELQGKSLISIIKHTLLDF